MATVWAFQEGVFQENPTTGWSHTIEFGKEPSIRSIEADGLRGSVDRGTLSLIEKLESAGLRGRVEKLAIVAHGRPGAVFMSGREFIDRDHIRREMQAASCTNLRDLSTYLQPGGMLLFVSCNAGKGPAGSLFLMQLSRELPGRVIVGFSIYGFYEQFKNDPGNVQESDGNRPKPGTPRMSAWGAYAKWAFKGTIVRVPIDEQKNAHGLRCANPHCPGHASERDRCVYEKWGHDPVLLKHQP